MTENTEYDVVIVGGSIAGCATATLLARAGVRVALLEKSPKPEHFKVICTHEIAGIGRPVLERLGILGRLQEEFGDHATTQIWSRYGWVPSTAGHLRAINVRRETLDPMLRELAASTPGVELRLGAVVDDVVRDAGGRPAGVRVTQGGRTSTVSARVVIGADGRSSSLARMTGVRARVRPHDRFGYYAYFAGVPDRGDAVSRTWILEPDQAYSFPTDDGLTLIALAPRKTPEALGAFRTDLEGEYRRRVAELPDGPDLSQAEMVGKIRGVFHTPNRRRPASAPGLAFVGDAAQTSDFVWGTGCGFALAAAEWLADAVGAPLASGASDREIDRGLVAYRRRQRRGLAMHHLMICDFSVARPLSLVERLLFGAAPHDARVAQAMYRIGSREVPPQQALSPAVLGRAAMVRARVAAKERGRAHAAGSVPARDPEESLA